LKKNGYWKSFLDELKNYHYSGLEKFASNMANMSTFSGKEMGQLMEVIPIILLIIKVPSEWIICASLIGEVYVDDYALTPEREDLPHRKIWVSLLQNEKKEEEKN